MLDEVLEQAFRLSPADRQRLLRRLAAGTPPLPISGQGPPPQSVAWLKSEEGHAVLSTGAAGAPPGSVTGAAAIAGMWADTLE